MILSLKYSQVFLKQEATKVLKHLHVSAAGYFCKSSYYGPCSSCRKRSKLLHVFNSMVTTFSRLSIQTSLVLQMWTSNTSMWTSAGTRHWQVSEQGLVRKMPRTRGHSCDSILCACCSTHTEGFTLLQLYCCKHPVTVLLSLFVLPAPAATDLGCCCRGSAPAADRLHKIPLLLNDYG